MEKLPLIPGYTIHDSSVSYNSSSNWWFSFFNYIHINGNK